MALWTIGHSNHSFERFHALLAAHGVTLVADVRRVPRSGRNPQFGSDRLRPALEAVGIGYRHFPELGGMRRPRPDSRNPGLQDAALRGYADHMETPAFRAALTRLLGAGEATAALCAEADPRDCHRNLLADAAVAAGAEVLHILADGGVVRHALSPLARVEGRLVWYPGLLGGPEGWR